MPWRSEKKDTRRVRGWGEKELLFSRLGAVKLGIGQQDDGFYGQDRLIQFGAFDIAGSGDWGREGGFGYPSLSQNKLETVLIAHTLNPS